ncbi:STAS domain-containing protein [Duganella sp. FT92W]|uniref:STAS domain-containing protein n=1 Tax=Pseudoduganella rivuli TaxID=2666085 RepID=A0A7X2LU93_9BURK|nr:STAS domain-containing protein [Pseudoduganella rivuli]MRV72797.1 STAS domain-containing protein [Pseudoduganella rivuli]
METSTENVAADSVAAVVIDGDLTVFTVDGWRTRLLPALAEHQVLTLDLGAVAEFDSAGLQLLALLKLEGNAQGRQVVLRNPAASVSGVVALYRMQELFGLEPA